MPYKSEAQRRYMHAQHPEIARKWDAEERRAKGKRAAKGAAIWGVPAAAAGGLLAGKKGAALSGTASAVSGAASELLRKADAGIMDKTTPGGAVNDPFEISKAKDGYRDSYFAPINPRSKTEVKQGTLGRRVIRYQGGAALGAIAGAVPGAAMKNPGLAQAGMAGGSALGATIGRTKNVTSGDVRATHRRTGAKAKGAVDLPQLGSYWRYKTDMPIIDKKPVKKNADPFEVSKRFGFGALKAAYKGGGAKAAGTYASGAAKVEGQAGLRRVKQWGQANPGRAAAVAGGTGATLGVAGGYGAGSRRNA